MIKIKKQTKPLICKEKIMLVLKLGIIILGVLAVCYAFFGALFAAHAGEPVKSKIMRRYKWASHIGIVTLFVGGFIIIFL